MKPVNPYQSSNTQLGPQTTSVVSNIATMLVPPLLAIVLTLILWLGFAALIRPPMDDHALILVWSATLFVSVVTTTYFVSRIWPQRVLPTSIAIAYALFGVAFVLLEGDTSNGTDLFQATVVYGSLIALPAVAYYVTGQVNKVRLKHSQIEDADKL